MGTGMKGMNVERGTQVVSQIQVRIGMVEGEITKMTAVKTALEANWHGPDSVAFIPRVEANIGEMKNIVTQLTERKTELQQDVTEQSQTSAK